MREPLRGLFVTGTNTGIGKTRVTTMIVQQMLRDGVHVGAYKPVCSGCEPGPNGEDIWSDIVRLSEAVGHRYPDDLICPQRFRAALAPPDAARLEGKTVDRELLRSGIWNWEDKVEIVLVEGVGGWRSPIAEGETVADLATDFQLPVLLVAGLELGGINHALLTLESIARRGLVVAGVVLNHHRADGPADVAAATAAGIRDNATASVLATIPHEPHGRLTPVREFDTVDWRSLCGHVNSEAGTRTSAAVEQCADDRDVRL